MAMLPPPPTKAPDGSYAWLDWYRKLYSYVAGGGAIPWSAIDFTGSKLSDILDKPHNVLSAIQGGAASEFYHLTAAQHANAILAVPNTRTLTAGNGLTGGGDLTANRTFDVGANADGSITVNANDIQVGVLASDAQHGIRGGGTQHAAATTGSNGFMSAADKTTLDAMGTYQSDSSTGTALTTATTANATSISLDAGDWDVEGVVTFVPAATTTITQIVSGISTTSATLPANNTGGFNLLALSFSTGAAQAFGTNTVRISLGGPTTVYLVCQATFGVSTMTVNGFIRARRAHN